MKQIGFFAAPILFFVVLLSPPQWELSIEAWHTFAVLLWVTIWWMTEAIPIPITALLPIVLFPLIGLRTIKEATAPFSEPVIYLFMGGFMVALAMQKHELHKRFALWLIRLIGTKPQNLIFGFMGGTAFISMWISNVAATMMMLPIALSIVDLLFKKGTTKGEQNFVVLLVLSIAYGASIGGLGTLIGTAPNALFAAFVEKSFGHKVGFAEWMMGGVPLVFLSLPLSVWLMIKLMPITIEVVTGADELIEQEIAKLGKWSKGEKLSALVFAFVVVGWIGQSLAESLFGFKAMWLSDTGIAVTGAILLFILPIDFKKGEFLLDLKSIEKLPWDVLLLFGGGLALAAGIQESGLAKFFGESLGGLSVLPFGLMIFLLVALTIILTEFTSNTALVGILLPVLAPLAHVLGINPMLLLIPATIAASTGFMMPVGTPPNAIAYGTGYVKVKDMMKVGLGLNLLFAFIVTFFSLTVFRWAFGI